MRVAGYWLLAVLMVLCAAGCGQSDGTVVGQVLESAVAPDALAVAKLTKADSNATVSSVYRLYLGADESGGMTEILRADQLDTIRIQWVAPDRLSVAMPCGRVFSFRNFFDVLSSDGQLRKRVVVSLENPGLCGQ